MRPSVPRRRLLLLGAAIVLISGTFNASPSSAHGLRYDGLRPGTGRCHGLLEITAIPGACTHGPDTPPVGLDVARPVPPLSPLTATPLSVVCDGDGQSGNRVRSEERRVGKEWRSWGGAAD